jgi:hypothetical protein
MLQKREQALKFGSNEEGGKNSTMGAIVLTPYQHYVPQTKLLILLSPEANVKIISFHGVLQISVYVNDWVALITQPAGLLIGRKK